MIDDADVERLARLLCEQVGVDPDELGHAAPDMPILGKTPIAYWDEGPLPVWQFVASHARQMLREREALAEFDRQEGEA